DDAQAFRFCPRCGAALERRLLKSTEPERLVCTGGACGFVFYLDPKIAVGTIITTSSDRLVLCRRAIEPGYGKWVFPGGYVDRGEPLTAAAIREAREECGLDIRIDGLADGLPRGLTHAPHRLLERADGLLARLVDELLFGVLRLPFFGRVRPYPLVHLRFQIRRERGMFVHHVLKIRREVNFAGADA